jgi:hypothetical protein
MFIFMQCWKLGNGEVSEVVHFFVCNRYTIINIKLSVVGWFYHTRQ